MSLLSYAKQEINHSDVESVIKALTSDFLTQGPLVEKFEEQLAKFFGAKYVRVTNSATSGLICACRALGIGQGSLVWTTPNSFVATANSALLCGASVDFIDIDFLTGNMSEIELEEKLKRASISNSLPDALVVVHYAGIPVNMEKVGELARTYGIRVIEDASHAVGSKYPSGDSVGSCRYSDLTVFSFHAVKNMTTGEGGCILTNSSSLAEKTAYARSHGINRKDSRASCANIDPWFYDQVDLGYNFRMSDFAAALGLSQLSQLTDFVEVRKSLVAHYKSGLDPSISLITGLEMPFVAPHIAVIQIPENTVAHKRDIYEQLKANGIVLNVHYRPIYQHSFFAANNRFEGNCCPNAEAFYRRSFTLPLRVSMKLADIERVLDSLNAVVSKFGATTA